MASPTDSPISLRDVKVRQVLWLWFSGAARALLIPVFAFVFAWVLYFLIEIDICVPFVLEAVAILSVAASSIPSELERTWCRTTPSERLNQTLLHWTVRISVFFTVSALALWYFRKNYLFENLSCGGNDRKRIGSEGNLEIIDEFSFLCYFLGSYLRAPHARRIACQA
jgi:hypothetical protein